MSTSAKIVDPVTSSAHFQKIRYLSSALTNNLIVTSRRHPCSSLCNLCVLCASVVEACFGKINHRDTENTEVAQRNRTFGQVDQSLTTKDTLRVITYTI